eukprot:GFKZ01003307.1.p1 GENE.GFKZ01003307.1~~GFKZ01003307.1.p1  ORF type:complete len:139 (+),score=7.90 GFKZ01003307.1:33-449(+)
MRAIVFVTTLLSPLNPSMKFLLLSLLFIYAFLSITSADENLSTDTSSFLCTQRVIHLGGACQCHLIRIMAIGLFKRISEEGIITGCLANFGPTRRWKFACKKLTGTSYFNKDASVRAVREITDGCPAGTLCNFFVINK